MPAQNAQTVGSDLANVPFDEFIKNLLLAMVSGQNAANQSFLNGLNDLLNPDNQMTITWTDSSGKTQNITASPVAFGIMPVLLGIQNAEVQIKMAISMVQKTDFSVAVQAKAKFAFLTASVNAQYSNSYSYSVDASSYIDMHIAPVPPPASLMTVINAIAADLAPTTPQLPKGGSP